MLYMFKYRINNQHGNVSKFEANNDTEALTQALAKLQEDFFDFYYYDQALGGIDQVMVEKYTLRWVTIAVIPVRTRVLYELGEPIIIPKDDR